MESLSIKEKALYDRLIAAEDKSLAFDDLNASEAGCVGKLTQKGLVETYKDYATKKRCVKIKEYTMEPEEVKE